MFLKVLRDFSKPHWFDIVMLLKGSTGMSVAELSKELKMSYMGVKQHCVDLEKKGYLDTWRRPKPLGRPEKAYRLTGKVEPLFPSLGPGFVLDILGSVGQTYGATAPEKLLFNHFQREADRYSSKLKGDELGARMVSLAKLRDAEGYRSSFSENEDGRPEIVEYHSLIHPLSEVFPSVFRMEEAMISKVLGAPVSRKEERVSGLTRISFSS